MVATSALLTSKKNLHGKVYQADSVDIGAPPFGDLRVAESFTKRDSVNHKQAPIEARFAHSLADATLARRNTCPTCSTSESISDSPVECNTGMRCCALLLKC
jgi:hypothetical protein